MSGRRNAMRFLAIFVAGSVLMGCELRPELISAHSYRTGEKVNVSVRIRSEDAELIRSRQLYFYLLVADCNDSDRRSSMDPYIAGQRAAEFDYPIAGQYVVVTGTMNGKTFDSFKRPCAMLEGGGYLSGTLRSSPTPIHRANAAANGDLPGYTSTR